MAATQEAVRRDVAPLPDEHPAMRRSVRESLSEMRTHFREADSRARAVIQARPLVALAAAVAVGFVLRRLLPFGRG
jgi:ElaB/YqjD/DUF883 family membrane-anchored ribosome-binding protein